MKKTIRKIGNSLGILFNKEECKINDYEAKDVLDLADAILIKNKKKKK